MALDNLFDNAVQALHNEEWLRQNPERNPIVRLVSSVTDGRIRISVEDNGPGIPDGIETKVFEPLFSTKSFGVGLGLPIVRKIVEQHRGDIEITSTHGQGTNVIIWLPLGEALDI